MCAPLRRHMATANMGVIALCLLHLATLAAGDNRIAFTAPRALTVQRVDPNISPGTVSQHVHRVIGGSNFSPTYDPEAIRQAKCSNLDVQADKSNYWIPQLYWKYQNGTYGAIGGSSRVYYNAFLPIGNYSTGVQADPFPHDFQMVAGDPTRKTFPSTIAESAMQYYCWTGLTPGQYTTGYSAYGFPNDFCHNLIADVYFPSCWNGQPYNSSNPTAHMRYPLGNIGGGGDQVCPQGYEKRLPFILIETFYDLDPLIDIPGEATPFRPGSYLWANGDTTGYGLHGDFQNGWDDQVLHDFIYDKSCQHFASAAPPSQCPALAPSYNVTAQQACLLETKVVNEPVGMLPNQPPLAALPGCNKPWSSGSKPTCRATFPPNFVNWTSVAGTIGNGIYGVPTVG